MEEVYLYTGEQRNQCFLPPCLVSPLDGHACWSQIIEDEFPLLHHDIERHVF